MDAPGDQDLKLQRKSGDLLSDFESSLARCLWRSGPERRARHVIARRQVERLVDLVARPECLLFHLLTHRDGILARAVSGVASIA